MVSISYTTLINIITMFRNILEASGWSKSSNFDEMKQIFGSIKSSGNFHQSKIWFESHTDRVVYVNKYDFIMLNIIQI